MEIKKRRRVRIYKGFEYLWVQFTAGGPGLCGMQARSIVSGDVAGW